MARHLTSLIVCLSIIIGYAYIGNSPQALFASNKKSVRDYYKRLSSIAIDSTFTKKTDFSELLRDYPEFEATYNNILEQLLFHGESDEAKRYFKALAQTKPFQRNSFWMLARIYALLNEDNDPDSSYIYYKKALYAGPLSYTLLEDFIDFNYRYSRGALWPAEMDALELNRDHKRFVDAVIKMKHLRYREALPLLNEISDDAAQKRVVVYLKGLCELYLSRHAHADSIWRKGLINSRKYGDWQSEGQFLNSLGYLLMSYHNDNAKARVYFNLAKKIAFKTGDLNRLLLVLRNIAGLEHQNGDYAQAREKLDKALRIAITIGRYQIAAAVCRGIGNAYFYEESINDALLYYNKSEQLARKSADQREEAFTRLDKGDVFAYLKQDSLANREYTYCFELAQKRQMLSLQNRALGRIADTFISRKKYPQARALLLKIIGSEQANASLVYKAYYLLRIGVTYKAEKNYQEAAKFIQQAYETAESVSSAYYMAWPLQRLGEVAVLEKNYLKALQIFHEKALLDVAKDDSELKLDWTSGVGDAYRGENDLDNAIAYYKQAADILEESTQQLKVEQFRIGFFSKKYQVYRNLAQCYYTRYQSTGFHTDLDSIFLYLELSQARALREIRVRDGSEKNKIMKSTQYREYVRATKQLQRIQRNHRFSDKITDSLNTQIVAARHSLIAKGLDLVMAFPDSSKKQLTQSLSSTFDKLKHTDIGLLFYHISDHQSFVFAATANAVKIVPLQMKSSSLSSAIDSLVSPFHNFDINDIQQTPFYAAIAHKLYQSLIKPVEEVFSLPERLLIIPNLVLMGFPFEILLSESPDEATYYPHNYPGYAEHFLLHRYTFAYSPSTLFLLGEEKVTPGTPKVLVITYSSGNKPERFSPLLYSEREAEEISKVYTNTTVFKGDQATKSRYLPEAAKYQVLHFATHAFVDTVFDAFSGVVLPVSADSTDDGLLMGYEISDLNLNCDLVTLSACETGQGKLVAGEGILGLPRLFFSAGAKSVLMTMWKANDKFASELMPQFYDYHLNKKLSKADALTKVKRTILKKYEPESEEGYYHHPVFWASFLLYGDPGMTESSRFGLVFSAILLVLFLLAASSIAYSFYVRRHKSANVS
ncbi:MAG: CHAT domain-containing protein [bacterium]